MSFQDVAQGGRELHQYGSVPAAPQSKAEKDVKDIISMIFKMQSGVSRLQFDVDKVGTLRDTVELRDKIKTANHQLSTSAKEIKNKLMAVHQANPTKQTEKLVNDFESALRDLQATLKAAKAKEAAHTPQALAQPPPPSRATPPTQDAEERAALLAQQQRQEMLQMDTELEYHELLVEERDQGIADIQQQIGEVAEIFQDLAVLVNDQGQMLDDIESNIGRTADSTKQANTELLRAERSQRSSRNSKCMLFLIGLAVLVVLIIVLTVV